MCYGKLLTEGLTVLRPSKTVQLEMIEKRLRSDLMDLKTSELLAGKLERQIVRESAKKLTTKADKNCFRLIFFFLFFFFLVLYALLTLRVIEKNVEIALVTE